MTRALVVTHCSAEGPGLLADWLPAAGMDLELVRPWQDEPVPDRLEHDALVVMGGPQQAYDDASAPWLAATKALLQSAVAGSRPVLGICLGAQLLAAACGGTVARGAAGPELGARLVARRDASDADPVFGGVPFTPPVLQWHWDAVVDLPPGALLLASSSRYPHQAFRVGGSAYGLQFHVETSAAELRRLVDNDDEGVRAAGLDPEQLYARSAGELDEIGQVWQPAVQRWAALASDAGR